MPRNSVVCYAWISRWSIVLPPFSHLAIFRLAPRKKGVNGDASEMLETGERPLRSMTYFKPPRLRSFVSNIATIRRSSSKQLHATLAISSTNVWYIKRIAEKSYRKYAMLNASKFASKSEVYLWNINLKC